MERLPRRENLYANWGDYVIGDKTQNFISTGFRVCSGLILRDETEEKFGLFHARPTQILDLKDVDLLKPFVDGEVILIEGTETVHNPTILDMLKIQVGMEHIKTIFVDTNTTRRLQRPIRAFHISFNPMSDQISITRNNHNGQLTYSGFK